MKKYDYIEIWNMMNGEMNCVITRNDNSMWIFNTGVISRLYRNEREYKLIHFKTKRQVLQIVKKYFKIIRVSSKLNNTYRYKVIKCIMDMKEINTI